MTILNIKNQITITKELLLDVLSNFDVELGEYAETKHGIANRNLFIKSKDGSKYVLKILRNGKNLDSLELELNFIEFLSQNNLPVIGIVQSKLSQKFITFLTQGKEWVAILMHQSIGMHPTWKDIDDTLLQNIATSHAKLHILGEKYLQISPNNSTDSKSFNLLENGLGRTVFELRDENFENYTSNKTILIKLDMLRKLKINLPNNLPLGYIHGDFDETNFLVDQNKISAILDFDDLRVEPVINCLSVILFTILKYYNKIRILNSLELDYLKDCMKVTGYFYFLWEMKTGKPESEILKCLDDIDSVENLIFKTD
jgi:Ser/Thr protein kinase RdoA (MazF antagonist)